MCGGDPQSRVVCMRHVPHSHIIRHVVISQIPRCCPFSAGLRFGVYLQHLNVTLLLYYRCLKCCKEVTPLRSAPWPVAVFGGSTGAGGSSPPRSEFVPVAAYGVLLCVSAVWCVVLHATMTMDV